MRRKTQQPPLLYDATKAKATGIISGKAASRVTIKPGDLPDCKNTFGGKAVDNHDTTCPAVFSGAFYVLSLHLYLLFIGMRESTLCRSAAAAFLLRLLRECHVYRDFITCVHSLKAAKKGIMDSVLGGEKL